jgi:hypothetical protein
LAGAAVRLFGLLATLSLLVTAMFYSQWFISVWCFFAALLSSVILLHFRARAPVNLVRWRTDCA